MSSTLRRRVRSVAVSIALAAGLITGVYNPAYAVATVAPAAPAVTDAAWHNAGAHLPIAYELSSLTGPVLYVAPDGSDNGNGSPTAPYATLAKAYSASAEKGTIVVRGGTYRQGDVVIAGGKPVRIIAYPGEIPVFDGAAAVSGGWTSEGSLQYRAYTPIPVSDGNGISFTSGQNLTGGAIGKYADEAWAGDTQLRQVGDKASVADGRFFVDRDNGRIYLTASDVSRGNIEVANLRHFLTIQARNSSVEGLRIIRFANSASDYGVIRIFDDGDNAVLRNVEISDSAFISVTIAGNTNRTGNLNTGTKLVHVTITHSNWMGVNATYSDDLVLDGVNISGMNQWDEFTNSPQSGALKTSRTVRTIVRNSQIRGNHSHGLWFDQSNSEVEVAGNVITDNLGSAVFFEISDGLLLVNNYIRTLSLGDRAVKLAGSSGLRLVNNTIIGGADVVGVYVDSRSKAGCADPAQAQCPNSYSSDRDSVRPHSPTMDWIPRVDLILNNVMAYPTKPGYCGAVTVVCITSGNAGASVPLTTVIHPADALRPRTLIDGNVYANGEGVVMASAIGNFPSIHSFVGTLRNQGMNIDGYEMSGLYGDAFAASDGTPTELLASWHSRAAAVPTDAEINQYVPAGTQHYGVLFK